MTDDVVGMRKCDFCGAPLSAAKPHCDCFYKKWTEEELHEIREAITGHYIDEY